MKSIRQRLFIQIGSLILLLIGLIFIANTLFLEDFYVKKQESLLLESYERINALEDNTYDDALDTYISIESSANIDIALLSDDTSVVYVSKDYLNTNQIRGKLIPSRSTTNSPNQPAPIPTKIRNFFILSDKKVEEVSENVQISHGTDPITSDSSLVLNALLDNGNTLNLRMPMASIRASIELINRFLLIIGAIVLFVALIFTYLLSNAFTKPIRQINQTALRLKELDFSTPSNISSSDELGELAQSINAMSSSLENNIKSLNKSNSQLKKEIEAKNLLDQKRRQLLNNVSHELKTPLALMQGYADALKLHITSDPAKVDFYCDVIVDETIKMNHLVQHLLDIDQVEFGDLISVPKAVGLSDYLKQMIRKHTPDFEANAISIKSDIVEDVLVFVDPLRLDQVMTNYITNAIHYCDHNKKVSITLKCIETNHKPTARVEVYNSSPAIAEEQLDKLWDSFYKIDTARTREVGGHGLGLSIVKAIQEADGNAYGSKNSQEGLVFWFDLPIITL